RSASSRRPSITASTIARLMGTSDRRDVHSTGVMPRVSATGRPGQGAVRHVVWASVMLCQALLLDMDGLMVDSEPLWLRIEADFACARGGNWTRELARPCIGGGFAQTLRVMGETFGFAVDLVQDTREIIERFVREVESLALKRGCAELLDAAEGRIPLAVAS